ncbi:MAG: hypothetical protein Q8P41_29075 [Pseudomonadota bacterium]|nr:hypothetical protein [Pseudomonadota bacterium]
MSDSVVISVVSPAALDAAMVDHLVALASRYLDLDGDWFAQRLRKCDHVLLYRDRATGAVRGTTTLDILDVEHEGRSLRVLYTGAVVLDATVRGRGLLQRAGATSFLRFGLATLRDVYWFCECDSFRGYRASLAFAEGWPRRGPAPAPASVRLYESLCQRVFGTSWNPETGVCAPIAARLPKRHEAEVSSEELRTDDDIAYFVERNPGYLHGEALPVLVPLDIPNLLSLGWTMAGLGHRSRATATVAEPMPGMQS